MSDKVADIISGVCAAYFLLCSWHIAHWTKSKLIIPVGILDSGLAGLLIWAIVVHVTHVPEVGDRSCGDVSKTKSDFLSAVGEWAAGSTASESEVIHETSKICEKATRTFAFQVVVAWVNYSPFQRFAH